MVTPLGVWTLILSFIIIYNMLDLVLTGLGSLKLLLLVMIHSGLGHEFVLVQVVWTNTFDFC